MTRGVSFSRPLAAAAAAALAAVCAVAGAHAELRSLTSFRMGRATELERSLREQIEAKSGCDRDRLEALHEQVSRLRVQVGAEDTWNRMIRIFGDAWSTETLSREDRSGCSFQTGVMRLKSPSLADWPGIVEAVRACEGLPGVGIAEFEMKTSGTRERRELDSVRIVVVVQSRRAEPILAQTR